MKIEINESLIKQVAKNSNLILNSQEISNFEADFKDILNNFDKLSKLDINEEPSFHPVPVKNKIREDVVIINFNKKEMLNNVILKTEEGFIKGPKVI